MTTINLKPADIIALREKNPTVGSILSIDATKTKQNTGPHKTYYIPIQCISNTGSKGRLTITFNTQLLASGAKLPNNSDDGKKVCVKCNIRKLSMEELEKSDYKKEDKAVLLARNAEFVRALEIISEEYIYIVENVILPYKGKDFRLINRTINYFKQTHRNPNNDGSEHGLVDDTGKIPIENHIMRITIPADKDTQKLGIKFKDVHNYVVFDYRKRAKVDGKTKHSPAKLLQDGKLVDLTIPNAKDFITYLSLVNGIIEFESICISKSGISLLNRVKELHVSPHKPMKKSHFMDDEELEELNAFGTDAGDMNVAVDDEPVEQSKQSKTKPATRIISVKPSNDLDEEDVADDDEPTSNNGDVVESEQEPEPEPEPEPVPKVKKTVKKTK